jgi:hypothetical protein
VSQVAWSARFVPLGPLVVGHIVGQRPPGLLSWLAAIVLFGGLAGAFLVRRSWQRRLCGVIAVLGLVATIADNVIRAQNPAAPNLIVRLISPGARSGLPLVVRVCGYGRVGRPASVNAGGRFMLIRIGGVQRAEVHRATVIVPVGAGSHLLTVDVTSPDHQEFQPRLRLTRRVMAEPSVRGSTLQPCPRHL